MNVKLGENMKIMLTISTLTGGGAERVVSVWANELAENNYDVSVLLSGRSENEYPLSNKVKVCTVALWYNDYVKLSKFEQLRRRRNILKQEAPDYLISFLPHIQIWSMISSWRLRVKRIETIRISPWHASINEKRLAAFFWKKCFKTSYKIILQSNDQMDFFDIQIQKKCIVIPNPISDVYENIFKTDFSNKATKIIAVGRVSKQKNYKMMIKAMDIVCRKYPEVQLKIYGAEDGELIEQYQELIEEMRLQNNVFFMGRHAKLEEIYKENDIYLLSSNFEGMPNALVEAMASQLVCISTDCKTGPRDLIEDGHNGFLVPVKDYKYMAQKIIETIEMPENKRKKIGQEARKKVLNFCSKENSLKRLEDIFDKRENNG